MSERRLKVTQVNKKRGKFLHDEVASIRLTGKWLEKTGFGIGHHIVVEESPGQLVITAEWRRKMDEEMRTSKSDERDVELGIAVSSEA